MMVDQTRNLKKTNQHLPNIHHLLQFQNLSTQLQIRNQHIVLPFDIFSVSLDLVSNVPSIPNDSEAESSLVSSQLQSKLN